MEIFHFSNLLQILNYHRVVSTELFGNFSCSCKMILSIGHFNFRWPVTALLIFKALVSFAKPLEPPRHYILISSSWAKCVVMLQVASADLWSILNSNKKIA